VRWQIETLEDGGRVAQATVLFDPDSGETRMMRSKEDAHDYRYFPDPDLLPVKLDEDWIEAVRAALPELPAAMQARFQADYGVSAYDAAVLTGSRALADYFEAVANACGQGKLAANWVMGDLSAALNRHEIDIAHSPVSRAQLALLIQRINDGTLSGKLAKEVFEALWQGEGEVDAIIDARGLKQVSDSGAIEAAVDAILAANPNQLAEYRSGKDKMFGFFVGQAMKAMQGKANPQQLNDILKRKLAG
jgi:aspartyl-tRNA(Asn)/glutamyl-tRNA(Gln) amidotransferase subunit B